MIKEKKSKDPLFFSYVVLRMNACFGMEKTIRSGSGSGSGRRL